MSKKVDEALCEVVFDISSNLSVRMNALDDEQRDNIMDSIDGSRGLFWNCVMPWAKEYQEKWKALTPQERLELDYLIHIDEYTDEKFDELVAQAGRRVASVQVVPVVRRPATPQQNEHVEPQFYGPTDETTGWAVYERGADGLALWAADFRDEALAMQFGTQHAALHGVTVEPQPWKEPKKQAHVIVADTSDDERFHVHWQIDIDAKDARDAALKAREIQLRPGNIACVFEVCDDNGGASTRIDLLDRSN